MVLEAPPPMTSDALWNARIEDVGATRYVFVAGNIDISVADDVLRVLSEAIDGSAKSVVVDLSELEFIDSSGIRELLRAEARAVMLDVTFGVTRPTRAVLRVFEVTNVMQLLIDAD